MIDIDTLLTAMITGIFVGLGSTVGAYIANRHIVKTLEKFEKAISESLENRSSEKERLRGHKRKYPEGG